MSAFLCCCDVVQIRQGSHSTHYDLQHPSFPPNMGHHKVIRWITRPQSTGENLTRELEACSKQDCMMNSTGDIVTCGLLCI